ncbi:MAG: DNA polymerase IV [Clostridia bacterium]
MKDRVILHCDLNNFYASVECLYRPEIRAFPVAVCGSPEERRGIVLAKNQLAKKFGVTTGEPIWQSLQKCPKLVLVRPNFELYLRFSAEAREIFSRYTSLVEAFGIDECWLDITAICKNEADGGRFAHEIKELIKEEMGVTASVGVSFNKIFAKLGSDMKKPDAVTVITRESFPTQVWRLPAKELLYVGRSTNKKLLKAGIFTIGDLAQASPTFLRNQLGKWGETLWCFANGMDESPVHRVEYEQTVKGVGNSMTLPRDLHTEEDVKTTMLVLAESVARRLRNHGLKGRTIQIYVRDNELAGIERQGMLEKTTNLSYEIADKAMVLFREKWDWHLPVRAVGVRVTGICPEEEYVQMTLLEDDELRYKREQLEVAIDGIRDRFGHYSIQRAVLIKDKDLSANPVEENVIHPVSYFR